MFLGDDEEDEEEVSSEEDRILLTDRITNSPPPQSKPKVEVVGEKKQTLAKEEQPKVNTSRRLRSNRRQNSGSRSERADFDSLLQRKSKRESSNEDNVNNEVNCHLLYPLI